MAYNCRYRPEPLPDGVQVSLDSAPFPPASELPPADQFTVGKAFNLDFSGRTLVQPAQLAVPVGGDFMRRGRQSTSCAATRCWTSTVSGATSHPDHATFTYRYPVSSYTPYGNSISIPKNVLQFGAVTLTDSGYSIAKVRTTIPGGLSPFHQSFPYSGYYTDIFTPRDVVVTPDLMPRSSRIGSSWSSVMAVSGGTKSVWWRIRSAPRNISARRRRSTSAAPPMSP